MMRISHLFHILRIRREERAGAAVVFSLFAFLHGLLIAQHWDVFQKIVGNYFQLFVNNFHLSGYDPLTYVVLSNWSLSYNIYRHPLLAYFMYVPNQLNQLLMQLTGVNCAVWIAAAMMLFCATYSYVFLFRICRQMIGVSRTDAQLLAALLFSFAYVIVPTLTPDHFSMSMFMLIFALYVSGRLIQLGKEMTIWQTILLFVITAGTTLSNGIKIFIDAFFVNKKRFFRPAYLGCAIILPALLIWGFADWQFKTFEQPKEDLRAAKQRAEARIAREKAYQAFTDTTSLTDSSEMKSTFNREYKRKLRLEAKARWESLHRGEAIKGKNKFLRWTDITTDRWDALVENLFGESVQLHQDYLLGDTLNGRPQVVSYRYWLNYVVEGILVLLILLGLFYGWRQRFLLMAVSGFAFDMLLHFGLGFGLNEVYIMSPHWLFVFPIVIGYALKNAGSTRLRLLRTLILLLAVYFFTWNLYLLLCYLHIVPLAC